MHRGIAGPGTQRWGAVASNPISAHLRSACDLDRSWPVRSLMTVIARRQLCTRPG